MAGLLVLEPNTGGALGEGAGLGALGPAIWGDGLPRDKGWGRSRQREGLRENRVHRHGVWPRACDSSIQPPTGGAGQEWGKAARPFHPPPRA